MKTKKNKPRALKRPRPASPRRFIAVLIILMTILLLLARHYARQGYINDFNYSKFLTALEAGHIQPDSVVFYGKSHEIKGKMTEEGQTVYNGHVFRINGNVSDKGFELMREHGVTPNYSNIDKTFWTTLLLSWLPLLLIFGVFMYFLRQLQQSGSRAFSFGKSRARLLLDKTKATFKDVAGIEEAKEELREIVDFLKKPAKFTKLGAEIPKGVLLIGPPGTGKTLLARAVAGEANVPFFTISGSDFVEMFVGVGASRVRDLFNQGRRSAPCLIFVDEIDAVGRHRGAGLGGGHDEREQTLNQLLVEMDGFESKRGIIIIAATNRPDVLDPALLRPGRFDRRVTVGLPDLKGREAILKVHTAKIPLSSQVDLSKVSRGTPGFSGADLKNLVNEAGLMAAHQNKLKVEMQDFEKARDKLMMGSERKSFVMSDQDKKITAYHEAGHAVVGMKLPLLDPIHKVTIVPRGSALGVTQTLPKEDLLNMSLEKAKNTLAFLFGGRAAEEMIFKDFTSGASNDIEKATDLARRMVCEWGMSLKIGPMAIGKKSDPVFIGMRQEDGSSYSEESAKEADGEIRNLILTAYQKAKKILGENLKQLHNMAQALLDFETIDSKEAELLIEGKPLEDLKAYRDKMEKQINKERDDDRRKLRGKKSKPSSRGGGSKKKAARKPSAAPAPATA